ncbi:hypothetical protein D3C74_434950 [compost metagenome]
MDELAYLLLVNRIAFGHQAVLILQLIKFPDGFVIKIHKFFAVSGIDLGNEAAGRQRKHGGCILHIISGQLQRLVCLPGLFDVVEQLQGFCGLPDIKNGIIHHIC